MENYVNKNSEQRTEQAKQLLDKIKKKPSNMAKYNECYGHAQNDCIGNCVWVKEYMTNSGQLRKGYCRPVNVLNLLDSYRHYQIQNYPKEAILLNALHEYMNNLSEEVLLNYINTGQDNSDDEELNYIIEEIGRELNEAGLIDIIMGELQATITKLIENQ